MFTLRFPLVPQLLCRGILLIPLFTLTGCIQQITDETGTTFRYELWVPLMTFVAGIGAVALGWWLRKYSLRYGLGLVAIGVMAALLLAPMTFLDQVTVTSKGFLTTFREPTMQNVTYDDIRAVRITKETTGTRRRLRTDYYLVCELKKGVTVKFCLSNDLFMAAAPLLLEHITAHGIPLTNET